MSAQSMRALERANEVRFARARVKRSIATGALSVPAALGLDAVASMWIYDVLQAQYGWGSSKKYRSRGVKAMRVLREAGVNPYRRVRDLTERQRVALVEALS